mmetsp:Transcript_138775/g.241316  ORF Transcript_138775/g.241316 Transcript_138775/m.241316 type:complete len:219 (+) Transcript_138775:907-1563(+)
MERVVQGAVKMLKVERRVAAGHKDDGGPLVAGSDGRLEGSVRVEHGPGLEVRVGRRVHVHDPRGAQYRVQQGGRRRAVPGMRIRCLRSSFVCQKMHSQPVPSPLLHSALVFGSPCSLEPVFPLVSCSRPHGLQSSHVCAAPQDAHWLLHRLLHISQHGETRLDASLHQIADDGRNVGALGLLRHQRDQQQGDPRAAGGGERCEIAFRDGSMCKVEEGL